MRLLPVLRPLVPALALAALITPLPAAQAPAATGELVLHKWSGDLNVPDPVAAAVDPQGRVYIAATTRRKVGDLDIREHRMWTAADVRLDSVEAKRRFYRETLAPGNTPRARGGLDDHNQDGSIDWQDLTHHTERIYQLRDTDGDGTADQMTVFAEGFNTEVTGIAAGVMWHDGWVYATIAPDVWRLKDTDDDGVADLREIVATGFGIHIAYAGHDMHGLTVGPDGRIYWSIGDKGSNVTSREGKQFYHPNEGAVFRAEPDGSGFEVFARGLRNPQEPAFDDFGNLFSVDNDADQPGERERFVYILEGSDTGWRANFQYMAMGSPWMREGLWKPSFDGQAAYLLPSIQSYSDGPAGFRFEPGTALGEAQRGNLILTEFPSGKIRGFRAESDGATFKMSNERIMNTGVMGIGLSWHPDGSLIMVDWIGGYPLDGLGAVWKVDAAQGRDEAARRETFALLKAGFSGLEEPRLTTLLAHRDQRVRQGAQLELAKRGRADAFLTIARNPQASLLSRVHSVWGYGQLIRRQAADATALRALLADPQMQIRNQTVKVLGDAAHARTLADAVIPLLNDPESPVRAQAAITLGKWQVPAAVPALLTMAARDGNDPTLRSAVAVGLAGSANAQELAAQARNDSVIVRLISVVALRRQASPAVSAFLQDANPRVVEEAARAIHDDTSIPAALPALAALLSPAGTSEIVQRRALNASFRLGTAEDAGRIADFALNATTPLELRREALSMLRQWTQPPELDLVDGWARTLQQAPCGEVLNGKASALLALTDPALKTLAIEVFIAHQLSAGPEQIAAIVADTTAPDALRAEALRFLAGRFGDHAATNQALDLALGATAPDSLAEAALSLLLPRQPDRLAREARTFLTTRGVPARQHAITLLAQAAQPSTDAVLAEQAGALGAGKLPNTLELDVIEAIEARAEAQPALGARLKAHLASPGAQRRSELLAGGNVIAGREIAQNHLGANCVACHRLESPQGSAVGPVLRGIGRQRDAASLLQSLIEPSAVVVPGYGLVTITLNSGDVVAGTLLKENADTIVVRLGDSTEQSIARTNIRTFDPPISIMPAMEGILTPRELRDLVAYLQQL